MGVLGARVGVGVAVALAVVSQLQQHGWPITETHMRQGLAGVRWEGRLEVLSRAPWVLLDGAHTVEAAVCLRQALTELFPRRRVHFVLGISTDKNVAGIIATLAPIAHTVTVTRYHNPRAYDPHVSSMTLA